MIHSDELLEVLEHWKEAREARLNATEFSENMRCTIDIVALLSEHGVTVPKPLWKAAMVKDFPMRTNVDEDNDPMQRLPYGLMDQQYERYRTALVSIANMATTEEGDREKTENEFGLDVGEVIEMAHDNMILIARGALEEGKE